MRQRGGIKETRSLETLALSRSSPLLFLFLNFLTTSLLLLLLTVLAVAPTPSDVHSLISSSAQQLLTRLNDTLTDTHESFFRVASGDTPQSFFQPPARFFVFFAN